MSNINVGEILRKVLPSTSLQFPLEPNLNNATPENQDSVIPKVIKAKKIKTLTKKQLQEQQIAGLLTPNIVEIVPRNITANQTNMQATSTPFFQKVSDNQKEFINEDDF